MKAINIQWDFDDGEGAELPNEIELPEDLVDEEEISDYISDLTGFCHKGFELVDDDDEDYDEDDDEWDDYDRCYECGGYGDDYFTNDDGELECYCTQCPFNPGRTDDWDD